MSYALIHTIRFIVLTTALFFAFACSPKAHAYFTTAQHAVQLDDTSALFLIEYTLGTKTHDVFTPIMARNGTTSDSAVSYAVYDEDGTEVHGKGSAIVLSHAPMQNGMYAIQKGTGRKLTLLVVFTPDTKTAVNEYRLQVTDLPFNFDGTQQLRLNPSELQYYTTKLIEL